MTNIQKLAFDNANSGSAAFTASDSTFLITGVLAALALLWMVWVCLGSYSAFGAGKTSDKAMVGHVLRALFVVVVVFAVISY